MNTDVELCSITDVKAKEKIMYALMKSGVPYAEKWEKVPLIKRKHYHGAKEICIVITHKAKINIAKEVIDTLSDDIKEHCIFNV